MNKADKQVVKDEADATERESVREAKLERYRAVAAAADAERHAAEEESAEAARNTFKARFLKFIGWE